MNREKVTRRQLFAASQRAALLQSIVQASARDRIEGIGGRKSGSSMTTTDLGHSHVKRQQMEFGIPPCRE